MAPLGIFDPSHPGIDLYAMPGSQRLSSLFAGPVPAPFYTAFAELGEEQGVARYLAQVAGASLVWPIPDRDLDTRIHRIRPPALVLWGASARKKKALVDTSRHVVIESPHPSPLSAHNGFFGSRPFSAANAALEAAGRAPVDWRLP